MGNPLPKVLNGHVDITSTAIGFEPIVWLKSCGCVKVFVLGTIAEAYSKNYGLQRLVQQHPSTHTVGVSNWNVKSLILDVWLWEVVMYMIQELEQNPQGPCHWWLSYKFGEAPTDIAIWNTGWYDGQHWVIIIPIWGIAVRSFCCTQLIICHMNCCHTVYLQTTTIITSIYHCCYVVWSCLLVRI